MREPSIPVALRIVAVLFLFAGAVSLVQVGIALSDHRILPHAGVLNLLIGLGLLRRSQGWRTCALVVLWIALIIALPYATLRTITEVNTIEFRYLGWPFRYPSKLAEFLSLAGSTTIFIWKLRVLTRPDVRALFGLPDDGSDLFAMNGAMITVVMTMIVAIIWSGLTQELPLFLAIVSLGGWVWMRRRRMTRYEVAGLAILAGATLMWVGTRAVVALPEHRAVTKLSREGISLVFDYHRRQHWNGMPRAARLLRGSFAHEFFFDPVEIDSRANIVTDDDLVQIGRLPKLRAFYVESNNVSDEGLSHLSGLSQVDTLHIRSRRISDAGFAHLVHLKKLRGLGYWGGSLTDIGLAQIGGLHDLQGIFLTGANVSDDGLASISGLNKLVTLDLAETPITGRSLRHLRKLQSLEHLILKGTNVGDEGFESLASLGELRSLDLEATKLTDLSIEHLVRLRKLEGVGLRGTHVSDAGLAALRAELPGLKKVSIVADIDRATWHKLRNRGLNLGEGNDGRIDFVSYPPGINPVEDLTLLKQLELKTLLLPVNFDSPTLSRLKTELPGVAIRFYPGVGL